MKKLWFIAMALSLAACAGEQVNTPLSETTEQAKTQTTEEQAMITVTGTVVFKEMEGGFYALDADDGRKFMPQGMNKSLLKNGMRVEVTGMILTDMLTFQQYGEVLKVVNSKMLDDSQVQEKNAY